jgi:hypothetical protein
MKPLNVILFGLLFTIIGVGLLIISIASIITYNKKNKAYIETSSVIVDYAYNDEGLQAIIVEYKVDGKEYRKKSNAYSNSPKSIGTEVAIKYNPNNPSDAIWVKDSTNIIFPLFSILFIFAGIFITISNLKKIRDNKNNPVLEQNNQVIDQQIMQQKFIEEQQVNQTHIDKSFSGLIAQEDNFQSQQQDINKMQQDQIDNQNNTPSNL